MTRSALCHGFGRPSSSLVPPQLCAALSKRLTLIPPSGTTRTSPSSGAASPLLGGQARSTAGRRDRRKRSAPPYTRIDDVANGGRGIPAKCRDVDGDSSGVQRELDG